MFNSLKYAKILEAAGLPRNQVETHIQILGDVIGEEMATKEDIKSLDFRIQNVESGLQSLASELRDFELRDFDARISLEFQKLSSEIKAVEHRLVVKLGGLMTALLAGALTLAKLLFVA